MGGNDQRPSLGLLVMALAVLRQPLIRDESALVAVAFAATLWSSAALSQAEAETEVAPSQPATVPTAPPAPSRVVPDEPGPSTPPVGAPNKSAPSSSETAAPRSSETAPAPLPTGAPAGPIESPAQAAKGSSAARPTERYSATMLTVVNGRAVSATAVAVLVGTKAVARSGPLASNTRVTLKLPRIKGCRISVVASFPGWYSAITRGKIDVCKSRRVLVRL